MSAIMLDVSRDVLTMAERADVSTDAAIAELVRLVTPDQAFHALYVAMCAALVTFVIYPEKSPYPVLTITEHGREALAALPPVA